ncbi:hypothetical protein ACLB2K_019031 [Fragaria x ananassa]
MDPHNIAALQPTVVFDKRYAELHEKARQLAYNLCVEISRNNPGISMDTKYYIANVCVNEGINTYLEAKWILRNPNNIRIFHEEAIANGILPAAAADCVPPNYPSPASSEDCQNPCRSTRRRRQFRRANRAIAQLGGADELWQISAVVSVASPSDSVLSNHLCFRRLSRAGMAVATSTAAATPTSSAAPITASAAPR